MTQLAKGRGASGATGTTGGGDREPASLVRVLANPDELQEAVQRAVAFERRAAAMLDGRRRRYEAMIPRAPVTTLAEHRAS